MPAGRLVNGSYTGILGSIQRSVSWILVSDNWIKVSEILSMLSATCCHYSYRARENSLKFTWDSLIVGVAFLFQFVGRNLISSNLVVVVKEPHPETVQELLSLKFVVEIKFKNLKCLDFHKDRTDPKFKPDRCQDVDFFFSLCLFWLPAAILFLENIFLKTCEKKFTSF